MSDIVYTHKGWFGLCPVYFANLNSDAPIVEPRNFLVSWLMPVSEIIYEACFFVCSIIDNDFEPQWPLKITGEIQNP